MPTLNVVVLGSGTSTGVPLIGCDCAVCQSTSEKNNRTRSSIALSFNNHNIVIDTTPEFRMQMLREKIKSLSTVLYTHTHADHCHGFDDLRMFAFFAKKSPIDCYLHADFMSEFKKRFSYAFNTNTKYYGTLPQVNMIEMPETSFTLHELEVDPIRLPHGNIKTNAFRIGNFAYATDFKTFPPEIIKRWRNKINTMIISGVRFRPHQTHSSIPESIATLNALNVKQGYITHLSHDVDYHKHSTELPSNVRFAFDGLKFSVPL